MGTEPQHLRRRQPKPFSRAEVRDAMMPQPPLWSHENFVANLPIFLAGVGVGAGCAFTLLLVFLFG